MDDEQQQLQDELGQLEQSIATLRNLPSGEAREAALAPLLARQAEIRATLRGSGAIAQGDHAKAAGERGVIVETVSGSVITGDNNSIKYIVNHYYSDHDEKSRDSSKLREQISSYLIWLRDRYGTMELRGIKREGQQVMQLDLEKVYVPLAAQSVGSSSRQIGLDQVLALGKRIIITGGPGSGKTTVLLHIAWILATAIVTDNPVLAQTKLGLTEVPPLPIFVPLSAYATYVRNLPSGASAQERTLAAFISNYQIQKQSNFDLPNDFFQQLLRDGHTVILLLDGLDEIPNEAERVRVRQAVEELVTGRETMHVVVTCRRVAYHGLTALGKGFKEVRVSPLADEHVEILVRQAYAHLYQDDPASIQSKADELLQSIHDLEETRRYRLGENVERLVISPLIVRMFIIVHFSERHLPQQRAELYMKTTDAMLLPDNYALDVEIAQELGRQVGGSRELHRDLVQYLAFQMHNRGQTQGREISEQDVRQILNNASIYRGLVDDFIALTRLRGTLLEERLGMYSFIHLAFQEYLAARYLVEVNRSIDDIVAFLENEKLLESWWREPALLMIGYLNITSPQTAQALLRRLIATRTDPEMRMAIADLAGTALLEWSTFSKDLQVDVTEWLAALFTDITLVSQVSVSRRVIVSRILGQLNDPREDITILPPLLTPLIKGGFLYGEKKEWREVVPFHAGVYLVTNAQFSHFIIAGGYDQQAWWSEEGWQRRQEEVWTQPRFWQDDHWNITNHPVVGVSWYEAEAFCNWLSITEGHKYCLPSEEEWERMARGQDGREYPWGDEWQEGRANRIESHIDRTNAVGIFPEGKSLDNAFDCIGNVWEWCANWYDERRRFRVLRGGSFLNENLARCTARYRGLPTLRENNVGFRVVSSPNE